jgi:signal transduction histidine kinase
MTNEVVPPRVRSAPAADRVGSWGRAILAVPLWLKLIGANVIIVAAAVVAVRIAAHDGATVGLLVGGVFAALALSMVINIALVMIALRPLRTLEQTAAEVWRGNAAARVPPSLLADRDMARVGHTLNLLVEALTEDRARSRGLAAYIIRQAEMDQSRVARELHESAAQRLSAQVMQVSAIARDTTDVSTRERLDAVREMAADTLEQLRALADTMYPQVLDDLGLSAAVTQLARLTSERYDRPVRTTLDVRETISPDVASVLYGVVQDALSGAMYTGSATQVRVSLTTSAGEAEVAVQHDGALPSETTETRAVRQRVALVDGRYEVSHSPEAGARVVAVVPLMPSNGKPDGMLEATAVSRRKSILEAR